MTGAVVPEWHRHPIKRCAPKATVIQSQVPKVTVTKSFRWADDGADFSISRDDPTCFDNTPNSELELVRSKIGLTLHQLWQAVRYRNLTIRVRPNF